MLAIFVAPNSIFSARAALGNNGVPVRCEIEIEGGAPLDPGYGTFFNCVASDGTLFNDGGQQVPKGYYFLVTDILVTPIHPHSTQTAGYIKFSLRDKEGEIIEYSMDFEDLSGNTISEHFTAPYFVLLANHKLWGGNWSDFAVRMYISGLLVTNLNYLPVIMK